MGASITQRSQKRMALQPQKTRIPSPQVLLPTALTISESLASTFLAPVAQESPDRRRPRSEPSAAVQRLLDELTVTARTFDEILTELRKEMGLPPPPRAGFGMFCYDDNENKHEGE